MSGDADEMKVCVTHAYQHYIERMGQAPGPMLADYDDVIERHPSYVVDKDDNDRTKGILGLLVLIEQNDEQRILLDNIAVLPEAQGQGVGRLLLEHAEQVASERGYNALHLYTHIRMTENIALYLRIGYIETEKKMVDGFSRMYMVKSLSS